ncbi:MAG: hypothetical protein CEE38_21200 [Planctomycetes bacterium B3_Pla]|nr:MAG: hypothetical protein CEE38_21200 [Planctomycetes bacterium B3_Pla]
MDVNTYMSKDYRVRGPLGAQKNKANQSQSWAFGGKLEALSSKLWIPAFAGMTKHVCAEQSQFRNTKVNVTLCDTRDYEENHAFRLRKNKANSKPIGGPWPEARKHGNLY